MTVKRKDIIPGDFSKWLDGYLKGNNGKRLFKRGDLNKSLFKDTMDYLLSYLRNFYDFHTDSIYVHYYNDYNSINNDFKEIFENYHRKPKNDLIQKLFDIFYNFDTYSDVIKMTSFMLLLIY